VSKRGKRKLHKRIKKSRKQYIPNPNVKNLHHCLYIGRHWDAGRYSRLLRNHWYFKIYIPANTLHRLIHQEVFNIPVPSEETCRHIYYTLLSMEDRGELSNEDSLVTRLHLIIELIGDKDEPARKGFEKQLQVVKEFYEKAAP